jgi:putative FmdB family regulatory protein
MPIYEYVCLDCKSEFELLRPMSESDKPQACQSCGSEHVRRKLAVVYALSGGHASTDPSGGCGSCSGGNCASCPH